MLIIKYENPVLILCSLATFSFVLCEITCYVMLYTFINKHNSGDVTKILKPSVINKRNKINAISLTGQVAGWIMETWYIVAIGFLNTIFNFELLREIAPFVKDLEFILIPLVQICTSEPIKKFMMSRNRHKL